MFGAITAESVGKFIFHGAIMASSTFSELINGSNSGGAVGAGVGTTMNLQLALHTGPVLPGDAQTVNEVSTGTWVGYARQNVIRSTSGWTFVSPNKFENAGPITFPTPTAGSTATTVSYLTIGSLANTTSNNRVIFCIPLAIATPRPFVADDVLPDKFYVPTHGFVANQEVMFLKTEGDALPSGGTMVAEGVIAYVKATGNLTDTFQVSQFPGDGTALTYTSKGSGYVVQMGSKTVGINDPFVFDTTNKITVFIR